MQPLNVGLQKKLVVAIFFKVPTEKTQEVDIGTKKELTRKKIACHINVFLCKQRGEFFVLLRCYFLTLKKNYGVILKELLNKRKKRI